MVDGDGVYEALGNGGVVDGVQTSEAKETVWSGWLA
jgi:hypothetical protein